jgi:putative serine protease PepD
MTEQRTEQDHRTGQAHGAADTRPQAPEERTRPVDGGGGDQSPADPWQPPGDPGRDGGDEGRRHRHGVALLVAVAVAAGLVGGGVGAGVTAYVDRESAPAAVSSLDGGAPASDAPPGSVERVAAAVLPSVVSIQVSGPSGSGEGSGIVLSSDGEILTNDHVVAPATQGGALRVTFSNGGTADARVVGTDPATDLAVIRAEGVTDLTPARLGSSADLAPGEEVVAIGSPLGLSGTVTSGIVSALERPVRTGGQAATGENQSTVIDAIQTDAAINPGNSGGALVDMQGQVVGVNSAIATLGGGSGQTGSIGLGFSIPIDQAKAIAEQLIASGSAEHALLGVSVGDAGTTGQSAGAAGGAAIASVQDGSSADSAGLRQGDVVTKVDDRAVDSADGLIAAIRSYRPGDQVTLTYVRGGSTRTAQVTLGSDARSS